ncbi:MAG: hypothetical protein ACKODG_06225 [Betaproteobacteria bacterium]
MSLEYAPKGLLGVLTPQANTTAEIEFNALMPPGFASLVARMTSALPDLEGRLMEYFERLDQSIAQFANAPLTAVAVACTGSSYLMGAQREDTLFETLSLERGVPVTSAGLSVVQACQTLGAHRIAVLSPYSDSLTAASVAYWQARGLEVVEVVRIGSDTTSFHPIYSIQASATLQALHAVQTDQAQAIICLGTGLPSLGTILSNPVHRSAPVFSCMLALAWNALRLAQQQTADATRLRDFIAGSDWQASFGARFPAPPG